MAHFNQKSTSASLVPNALPGYLSMYFDENNRISFKDRFGNVTVDADILNTSSSFAQKAKTLGLSGLDEKAFLKTGSTGETQTVTGSLVLTQGLTVLGSASFTYITASQVLVDQNTITVFANGVGLPTAGYIVADSGSVYSSSALLYNITEGAWNIDNGSGSIHATASHALTASYIVGGSSGNASSASYLSGSEAIVKNLTVTETASVEYFIAVYTTTSFINLTGSNTFGASLGDLQLFTGSVGITGSFTMDANSPARIKNLTASMDGTASVAMSSSRAISASYATSASYASGSLTASYALTASYVSMSLSSSFALTASYAYTSSQALTASYVSSSQTASFITGSNVNGIVSSSYTASYAFTASYVSMSQTASRAFTSSLAYTASYAFTASEASNSISLNGFTSSYFINIGSASLSQVISGSLTITEDVRILGSASIVYITSSQESVGTNIFSVEGKGNSVPLAGFTAKDSGSTYDSGSLIYNLPAGQWTSNKSFIVSGSLSVSQSISAASFTGSFNGTASYAATASYVGNYVNTYTSATSWTVTHNLNLLQPYVVVYSASKMILPDEVIVLDSSSIQIDFTQAVAGTVRVF